MRNQLDPTTLTRTMAESQELGARVDAAKRSGTTNSGVLHNGVRYRLYTETRSNLAGLTSDYFDGANLTQATGLWQGLREESTIIEIVGLAVDYNRVLKLAEAIKVTNNQSAVLVTREPIASVLV